MGMNMIFFNCLLSFSSVFQWHFYLENEALCLNVSINKKKMNKSKLNIAGSWSKGVTQTWDETKMYLLH